MCIPQCICEKLGDLGFEEAIKAWKYVRHYTENLQKLQGKLRDLGDCTTTITREVSEAIGRDDEIEGSVLHWQTDADSLKVNIEQLIGESTTKASISCIACSCPNIVWRYKFSKQAEDKIANADALIVRYNNFHQISHPKSHCAENLQKLKDKLRDLEDCRKTITRKVSVANGRGDEIEDNVSHWQTDADSLKDDIEQLIKESTTKANICSTSECPFPDITWQYKFSKQAEEKIADANGLIIKYNNFKEIAHPRPRPSEIESLADKNYVKFDSRASIVKDIMDALKHSNVNMIGVFGLGGVGKTTLVKEVGEQMRKDGTFKQVAMAVVSKDLNEKEVQSKLADSLNFEFKAKADDKERRATELWNKFTNGDKYLIILDDIWEKVDLKAIGIPITDGKTGCKVVLTSRNKDLLSSRMEVNRNFSIGELLSAEAWTLFTKKVGNSFESQPELYALAYKVCTKCKGLPIAVNALGEALKGKQEHAWTTALDKLEKYMLTKIEGIDPSVLASLRVSYDMLPSADAKSCFLLCCLFAEDAEIPIDELMRHCVARNLLDQNPRTLDKARDVVRTVVDTLKSASLLTTGGHETVVQIHDVIRDVGISIAREEEAFLVDHGALRWPRNPTNGPSYKAMSLSFKNIKGLPDGLQVYQQLETLMVDNSELSDLEVPDNFFNGMMQLTVLTFTRMHMRRLPSSLAKLTNLRMLCLNRCELEDIAILKDLKSNLEVLSLRGSSIEVLPSEIGQLTSLRVLDLQDCYKLKVIPRGVISNLTELEELYFPMTFDKWEATTDEQQDTSSRGNVSLEELRSLLSTGQLTTLHVYIRDVMLLPKEDLIFANLKGFKISVGYKFDTLEKSSRKCMLKLPAGIQLRNEFIPLVDKAEVVVLCQIEGLKKVFHDRGVGNRFLDLKYLEVGYCVEDLYLLGEPKSSVQSHELHRLRPFHNLTVLLIYCCQSKYLFSPTTAKRLVHLEVLKVRFCKIMEGIVGFEGGNDEDEFTSVVKFSKLEQLELQGLPNLVSFYAQKVKTRTTMGSSSSCAQPLFSEKVIFPVLERLTINGLGNIIKIWDNQLIAHVLEEQGSFCQLKSVDVRECAKLMHVFPSNMHPLLKNLEELEVRKCETMKGIAELEGKIDEDGVKNEVASPVRQHLEMVGVTKIQDNQPLPEPRKEVESLCKLVDIRIEECDQLLYVFPSHMFPQNLQKLWIENCDELEVIFSKDPKEEKEAINDDIIMFPRLEEVRLWTLPKLKSFYPETQGFFSHKVVSSSREHLEMDRITEIQNKQPLPESGKEVESLCKPMNIVINKCDQLLYVFPSHMLPQNLQELWIADCDKLEVIFSKELKEKEATNNDIIVFPWLKEVTLRTLPKLKSFYPKTQGFFSHKVAFPILQNLDFRDLDKITKIWDNQPLSEPEKEAKSFCKLIKIFVSGCNQLEYVLPFYMLPQLKNLLQLYIWGCRKMDVIISNNPMEKEATNNNDTIRFPQLKSVDLHELPNLISFICSDQTQLLFSNKVAFPVLEDLSFSELDKITRIWDEQPLSKQEKEAKSFYKLMKITVFDCEDLEYALPFYLLSQLKNLQRLIIRNCRKMEVIISNNPKEKEATNSNDTIQFPQLKEVILSDLPNLKSFICSDETQLLFSNKVAFPVLQNLDFQGLDKITKIWDNQPLSEPEKEAKSFCELTKIVVCGCNQLEYVLPFYILPQLKNLQKLHIGKCRKMEVIIISNNPKEKEATNNNDTIRFPQLKKVELKDLPNLKSFICSDETQLFFSNKVAFPVLEKLDFLNLDKITRIWDNQPLSEPEKEAKSFCQLKKILVNGCNQLEYLLPFYMLPQLKKLQELSIRNCTKVEVIISNNPKEKETANNTDTIRFPQLKEVELKDLPNLKSFICSETQLLFSNKDAFPVLEKIKLRPRGTLEFLRNETSTKEVSMEDAFPVLEEIDLDEYSEIFRDGTYTKEVSTEEWRTSNEESDHNGEELDEDLKTPTKKVSVDPEECSTSGKENDHNGEELDEDLETPTKEISMEECGTSGQSGKESEHNGEQG